MTKKIIKYFLIGLPVALFLWFLIFFIYDFITPYGVSGTIPAERVYKEAIERHDISICKKIHLTGLGDLTSDDLRSECYKKYAQAFPKEDACRNIFTLLSKAQLQSEVYKSWANTEYNICVTTQSK